MTLSFDDIEEYLITLNKNYSILFTYDKGPLNQLKIHYASHIGEFYYSFRNEGKIDSSSYSSVDLDEIESIKFYLGLLVSSFEKEDFDELIKAMEEKEHFPIQKPEVLNKLQKSTII